MFKLTLRMRNHSLDYDISIVCTAFNVVGSTVQIYRADHVGPLTVPSCSVRGPEDWRLEVIGLHCETF